MAVQKNLLNPILIYFSNSTQIQDGTIIVISEGPAKLKDQFETSSGDDCISVHLRILGIESGNDFITYSFIVRSLDLSSLFPACKS